MLLRLIDLDRRAFGGLRRRAVRELPRLREHRGVAGLDVVSPRLAVDIDATGRAVLAHVPVSQLEHRVAPPAVIDGLILLDGLQREPECALAIRVQALGVAGQSAHIGVRALERVLRGRRFFRTAVHELLAVAACDAQEGIHRRQRAAAGGLLRDGERTRVEQTGARVAADLLEPAPVAIQRLEHARVHASVRGFGDAQRVLLLFLGL